jgi:hypothetical protein
MQSILHRTPNFVVRMHRLVLLKVLSEREGLAIFCLID